MSQKPKPNPGKKERLNEGYVPQRPPVSKPKPPPPSKSSK
jgi:hypothetical protein